MQNTTATRIVILTDTNWKAYKASIYAAALQSGNMDLLRKSTKPTDAASLPDWNLKNDKINGFILGSISVSHHHLFSINEDCYNNFRNLEKWHHDNRAVNQEIYLKRLKDELQKNSDILTHLNNWMIRLEDYKGVDGKLEELQQCRILLASLNPVQWNSFSMTIETSDKITQTDGTEVDNKLKLNYLVNRIKEVAATLNLSKPLILLISLLLLKISLINQKILINPLLILPESGILILHALTVVVDPIMLKNVVLLKILNLMNFALKVLYINQTLKPMSLKSICLMISLLTMGG